jgi:hypothetical protein
MIKLSWVLGLMLIVSCSFGQAANAKPQDTKAKIDAINKYVDFVNESIHGMFMVNRLLVEYNMDLNKYVDLESEKINNYSNKDLPLDIFEDKDHWFYEISPYELLNQAKKQSVALDPSDKAALDNLSQKFLAIIKSSNQLRLDMDKVSQGVDFSKKENIDIVYRKLEEGLKHFSDFYKTQIEFEKLVEQIKSKTISPTLSFKPFYDSMSKLHKSSETILMKVRAKEVEALDQIIKMNSQNLVEYKQSKFESLTSNKILTPKLKLAFDNSIKLGEDINVLSQNFLKNDVIPSKYKSYGRFYFYYNVEMISKFNKYGSGMATEMNNLIQTAALPLVKFTELPHLFQIIYPKKIVTTDVIKASDDVVSLPTTVKERTVVNNKKTMRVESDVVEIQLYDHMIADGDVVSINFNGDWILEKEELERGSKTVKLKLNPEGKNYLLLHADNVGKRPPNTMALSYKFRGDKVEIVLKSDNNVSEMIEIVQVKK